jgi:hypothetical protein
MRTNSYNFDDTLKIGDLVVNHYNSTICEIVDIQRRFYEVTHYMVRNGKVGAGDEYNPLIVLKKRYTADFKPVKSSSSQSFDGGYAIKLTDKFFEARIQQHRDAIALIEELKKVIFNGQ